MTGYIMDSRGRAHLLPALLSWDVSHTTGRDSGSFSVSFLYEEAMLPVLKQAKYKWPQATKLLYALRTNIRSVNDVQAILLGVKLTDPGFVNSPHAKDYAFLVTGEACPW